jgi:DNA-binding LacI/PurR family transcriptional regulator
MKRKKNSFRDVARLAGVSAATVSRLVNKSAHLSPPVEKRVRIAADRVGVSLQRKSSNKLIAFLLSNRTLLHPFHSHVLVASEAYCAEHGYSLLFFSLHYPANVAWDKLHLPHILEREDAADGFIVAGVNSENLLTLLAHLGVPFSVFGDTVQGKWKSQQYDVVWIDDITGAYEMTRYLHSLGHSRIWYVANTRLTWFARRHLGYCRAMEELGLQPLVAAVDSNNEREVGLLATKYILRRGEPVGAIFCGSDATSHGVYAALRETGMRIPEDVSVAGFNDTIEATMLHPSLTSVRVFPEQVGRLLGELVMNRIENPRLAAQERMIPTQVVKRESCQQSFVLPERGEDRQSLSSVESLQKG